MDDNFPFGITIEDLLRFLGSDTQIYSDDSRVFIRELVQNALDAILLRPIQSSSPFRGRITISYEVDFDESMIRFTDNGLGLDEKGFRHLAHPLRGIEHYLGGQLDPAIRSKLIGRFGAGLLSVFKVSDHVEIESKREGHRARHLDLEVKRVSSNNSWGEDLNLTSRLWFSNRTEVGTTITVHLGSSNGEVAERSLDIDDPDEILAALYHFIPHPPPEVDIVFRDEYGEEKKLQDLPYLGADVPSHEWLQIPGVTGYIAYQPEKQATLKVCQRGILVRENYAALLPPDTFSIVGEIDLQNTQLLSLKPSREEFLENSAFEKLKQDLAQEIDLLMKKIQQEAQTDQEQKSESQGPAINEDSLEADDLLAAYLRNNENLTAYDKIEKQVAFKTRSSKTPDGQYLRLSEIAKLCRELNQRTLYVQVLDDTIVKWLSTLDTLTVYEKANYQDIYVEGCIKKGAPVIVLHELKGGGTYVPLLRNYFDNSAIRIVDLSATLEFEVEDTPLPGSPNTSIRLTDVPSAAKRRVFRGTGRSWLFTEYAHLNRAHPQVQQILDKLETILASKDHKTLYKAYVLLLSGRLDDTVRLLEKALLEVNSA